MHLTSLEVTRDCLKAGNLVQLWLIGDHCDSVIVPEVLDQHGSRSAVFYQDVVRLVQSAALDDNPFQGGVVASLSDQIEEKTVEFANQPSRANRIIVSGSAFYRR